MRKVSTVSAYIAAAPKTSQPTLKQLRKVVRVAVPGAEEKLSYGMPYYSYHGRLAYFAAFRDHCSFFVMSASRQALGKELAPFLGSKSTMHLPFGSKVPVTLIRRILRVQVKRNVAQSAELAKRKKKTRS